MMRTLWVAMGISVWMVQCDDPKPPAPQPPPKVVKQTGSLWKFLESFRTKVKEMPTTKEIQTSYGEPNERMTWAEGVSAARGMSASQYRRYAEADQKQKELLVTAWRYHYKGDSNRWADVIVRDSDGGVVGWEWFENVPPGQETGPPKE